MEAKWLAQGCSPDLLVFFSGWGFDEKCVAHLSTTGYDVLVNYDYSSLAVRMEDISHYRSFTVVAWSFGVWAAGYVAQIATITPNFCYAINGTLNPVDDQEGIPTAIFQGTLDGLNERSFQKFLMRICGGASSYAKLQPMIFTRSFEACKVELESLARYFKSFPVNSSIWSGALISDADSIFPYSNMKRYWGKNAKTISKPHFCFADYKSWQELLNEFKH